MDIKCVRFIDEDHVWIDNKQFVSLNIVEKNDELTFVDPDTHEKIVFKRVKSSKMQCGFCGDALSEIRYHDGKPYRHCYGCHFERNTGGGQLY